MMRLGVSVILSKKCGAFDKRWIRKGATRRGSSNSSSSSSSSGVEFNRA